MSPAVRPWLPLMGIPVGLLLAVGAGLLPEPWGFVSVLALCVGSVGMCLYFLWDIRRSRLRLVALLEDFAAQMEHRHDERNGL